MQKYKYIRCNPCRRNFSNHDLVGHLLLNHFPEFEFSCSVCGDGKSFGTAKDLYFHASSTHYKNTDVSSSDCVNIINLYNDGEDVLKHIRQSTNFSFSYVFEDDTPSKKACRPRIIDLNAEQFRVNQNSPCELCVKTEKCSVCCFCAEYFSDVCQLKSHMLDKHSILPKNFRKPKRKNPKRISSKKSPSKTEETQPACNLCGKQFSNLSNVKRHWVNKHFVGNQKSTVFTCDHCQCSFSNKSSVKRHIETLHLKEKTTRRSISCFRCEQLFSSIKNLNLHLTVKHGEKIEETKIKFSDLSEFWEWKQAEETRTNSRFIQLRGPRKVKHLNEEYSSLKFICNRSGIFHSKSNGKRADRTKGSSKIGRFCSAFIEIIVRNNISVDGTYCSTHCGHDNDLRFITLTKSEKQEFYDKIKKGISFSAILNEIRSNAGKDLKRKDLVTNKDLHNIVSTFKKLSPPETKSQDDQSTLTPVTLEYQQLPQPNDNNDHVLFSQDLDICADLWVETCQRMVNRFDKTEIQSSNDLPTRISTNVFVNGVPVLDHVSAKPVDQRPISVPVVSSNSNIVDIDLVSMRNEPVVNVEWQKSNGGYFHYKLEYPSNPLTTNATNEVFSNSCVSNASPSSVSIRNDDSAEFTVSEIVDGDVIVLPAESFDDSCVLTNASNGLDHCEVNMENDSISGSPEKRQDLADCSSDLQDRINNVSALYSIVESELDEQKKEIIRNNVDNIFRVLEYGHDYFKTAKKHDGKVKTTQSVIERQISRRRKVKRSSGLCRN